MLQIIGLKYFQDLQHRIPRDEVRSAEDIIRKAVIDVLPSRATDEASAPLYAYCMGSYLRGKPATGEHDIPPPGIHLMDYLVVMVSHKFCCWSCLVIWHAGSLQIGASIASTNCKVNGELSSGVAQLTMSARHCC